MRPRERSLGSCAWLFGAASFVVLWLAPAVVLACTSTPAAPTCGVAASCLLSHNGSLARDISPGEFDTSVKVHTMIALEGSDPRCGSIQALDSTIHIGSRCESSSGVPNGDARGTPLERDVLVGFDVHEGGAPLTFEDVPSECEIDGVVDLTLPGERTLAVTCEPATLLVDGAPRVELSIAHASNDDVIRIKPGTQRLLYLTLEGIGEERIDGEVRFVFEPVEHALSPGEPFDGMENICGAREPVLPLVLKDCSDAPFEPVCGCDGKSYPSMCDLDNAGVGAVEAEFSGYCQSGLIANTFAVTGLNEVRRAFDYGFYTTSGGVLCVNEGCGLQSSLAGVASESMTRAPFYLGISAGAPVGGLYNMGIDFQGVSTTTSKIIARQINVPVVVDTTQESQPYSHYSLLDVCDRFDCCPRVLCSQEEEHCDAIVDVDCDGLHEDYDPAPRVMDGDEDGLDGLMEVLHKTDPTREDTDDDGLSDGQEVIFGTDATASDTDGDGLTDGEEVLLGTNPTREDSDGDGLADGEDAFPWHADADNDGLIDSEDGAPSDPDRDGDGLRDGQDPWNLSDNDGDGLSDGFEVSRGFDPDDASDPEVVAIYLGMPGATTQDTDEDGVSDASEVFVYGSDPNLADTDGDGLVDGIEVGWPLLDPTSADTDGDGLSDGVEVDLGLDPRERDTDHDGLTDGDEVLRVGSNPKVQDTDGGGVWDGDEVRHGFDPGSDGDDRVASRSVQPHAMLLMPDAGTMYGFRDGALDGLDVRRTTSRVETYGGRARLIVRYELFPIQPSRPDRIDLHHVHYLTASGVSYAEFTRARLLEQRGEDERLEFELAGKGFHDEGEIEHLISLHSRVSLWAYSGEEVSRTPLRSVEIDAIDGSDLVSFWDLVPAGKVSIFTAAHHDGIDAYELVFDIHATEIRQTNKETDCSNSIDDDGDGFIDGNDNDCLSFPEVCNNGFDDDGDGLVDLTDPDCSTFPGEEVCGNGFDDDGDGLIDCTDPDCQEDDICSRIDPGCANGCPCVGDDCPPEKEREICGDCIDNDLDGLTDCEEIKCRLLPECRQDFNPCDEVKPPKPGGCCGTCSAAPPSLPLAPTMLALLTLFGLRSRRRAC